jgi:hypothetical protein
MIWRTKMEIFCVVAKAVFTLGISRHKGIGWKTRRFGGKRGKPYW